MSMRRFTKHVAALLALWCRRRVPQTGMISLSMPEMRASGTGILIYELVYIHLCPVMLLMAFKLITYGTTGVKRPNMFICVFLCIRITFYIIILYPY